MKNVVQKIFLGIGILILIVLGVEIYNAFMANHTYYAGMKSDFNNWKMILGALVSAMIPIAYIIWSKKFSLKNLFFYFVPMGLLLFAIINISIKDTIIGKGFLPLIFNNLLLYAASVYFIVGSFSIGDWISSKVLKFKETRRQELMINFGIGFGAVLLLIYILMVTGLLYGLITRLIFIGLGVVIYFQKKSIQKYTAILENVFKEFSYTELQHNRWKWIGIALLLFSVVYYFYGFQLSFIPYSTAWDANHAYMYFPKVWANNHGLFRGNGPVSPPYVWSAYITFWFSLIGALGNMSWLAPETFAVNLNFVSGVFVLVFGLGLMKQIIEFFVSRSKNKDHNDTQTNSSIFYVGRFLILLWISSGMGAFLVFVDNKTDMGVLALTLLALLSGFMFIDHISKQDKTHLQNMQINKNNESLKYVAVSGLFFALAAMAKPTAFLDILVFGILLIALWFGNLLSLGVGIAALGMMGILKPLFAFHFLNPAMGKYLVIIGGIIAVAGIVLMLLNNKNKINGFLKIKKNLLSYVLVRFVFLVGTLLLFKGPYLVASQIANSTLSVGSFAKSLLLGKNNESENKKVLLAQNGVISSLKEPATDINAFYSKLGELQCSKDKMELLQKKEKLDNRQVNIVNTSLADCKVKTYTQAELTGDLIVPENNGLMEDVGRYVGYGWKEFKKPSTWSADEKSAYGFIRLGYPLLRLMYNSEGCHSANGLAKDLCTMSTGVDNFDLLALANVFEKYEETDTAGYKTLCEALTVAKYKNLQGTETGAAQLMRDQVVALRQYYQSHSVKVTPDSVSVPYRYVVPLNVVFNRSLQNLSSYYTDIGFIRLLAFILMLVSLIYAIIKKDNNLVSLNIATIVGWAIRRAIGGGIVWYGIGLMVWTILVVSIFFKRLFENNEDESDDIMLYVLLGIFILRGFIQITLNFVRISSQGSSGPFARYKMSTGKKTVVDETLQYKEVIGKYTAKDVFDLQFPHYNKFIDATADKPDEDGISIAGTYLTYFVKNQKGMNPAGFDLNKLSSDSDICKTYTRFKELHMKYIIIDPNIVTVVMGEGNESLFNRFFAKRDSVTGKITEHGTISMLTKMYKDGYIKLFNTSNLGAKYAFSIADDELKAYFGATLDADQLLFIRAQLNIARFFPADSQKLIEFVGKKLAERFISGKALGDVADVYGKVVRDEAKLLQIAQKILSKNFDQASLATQIKELTNDERIILTQYVGMEGARRAGNAQFQEYVNSLLSQSIGGSSQLVILELE